MPNDDREHDLTPNNSMSNTSHCLALKKVAGPVGGPSSGGTMIRRRPPGFISFNPSSKPGIMPLIPNLVAAAAAGEGDGELDQGGHEAVAE